MHLVRTLVVSSFVLLSSSTLAEAVFAESREPQAFKFKCNVPRVGTERCGNADLNLRVKKGQQLVVMLKNLPKGTEDDPIWVDFFVYHAVTGDELAKEQRITENGTVKTIWTNHKDQAVDVFAKVGSNIYTPFVLEGTYVIQY